MRVCRSRHLHGLAQASSWPGKATADGSPWTQESTSPDRAQAADAGEGKSFSSTHLRFSHRQQEKTEAHSRVHKPCVGPSLQDNLKGRLKLW